MVAFFIAAYLNFLDYRFKHEYSFNILLIGLSAIVLSFLFSIMGAIFSTSGLLCKNKSEGGNKDDMKMALNVTFIYIPLLNLVIAMACIAHAFLLEVDFPLWTFLYIIILIGASCSVSLSFIYKFYLSNLSITSKNYGNTIFLIFFIIFLVLFYITEVFISKYTVINAIFLPTMWLFSIIWGASLVAIILISIIYRNKMRKKIKDMPSKDKKEEFDTEIDNLNKIKTHWIILEVICISVYVVCLLIFSYCILSSYCILALFNAV